MKKISPKRIKSWIEEERPREKFRFKGKTSLSDAELIAIMIGSGSYGTTAVDLARIILSSVKNNLHDLAALSCEDLIKFEGIGQAKALSILAALELGRRRKDSDFLRKGEIVTSRDVYVYFKQFLLDLKHEEFWILLLKQNNTIIKAIKISSGGVAAAMADTKLIFRHAFEHLATSIILVHNHPSGSRKPSKHDIKLTRDLVAAGKLMEVMVRDHLIFTDNGYFSFSDESMIA